MNYEKLGAFYLGRRHDLKSQQTEEAPLLYDARDLTTHAVCVGMTGSGKTGLCISLLEEAALDGIPALLIDPKGDLGNLLLTFPELRGQDFAPWASEDDARRKGLTLDAYAEQQATLWRSGLASWGQDGDRIRRLRESAEFAIYTPGSEAGIPVSILASFEAPPPGGARRPGPAAGTGGQRGHEPAESDGDRRGSDPQPRAHPAFDDSESRMVARRGTGSGGG